MRTEPLRNNAPRFATVLLAGLMAGQIAVSAAEGEPAPGRISIELNRTETVERDCRVTLMVSNRAEADLAKLSLELVLIGGDGKVADFLRVGILPVAAGRSRAQRFDIAGMACEGLGRILLNDVSGCEMPPAAPAACAGLIDPSSRTAIGFASSIFAGAPER